MFSNKSNRHDKYYYPWPEKKWQEHGHFKEKLCKNHKNMEIVVGGHYVKRKTTQILTNIIGTHLLFQKDEARLLHFEFRGKADEIYKNGKN